MTTIFLNLVRKGAGFSSCLVTASIAGEAGGFATGTREFYPLSQMTGALEAAGIMEHRYKEAVQVVNSGYGGSFFEISVAEGEALQLLSRT